MNSVDPPAPDLVFYDGDCGLCHGTVLFLLRRDPEGRRFRFAPLQGETFNEHVPESRREALPDSIVIETPEHRLVFRSAGTVRLLRRVGGIWSLLAGVLWVIPRPVRDLGYRIVAATRHHLFNRPIGLCPVVPVELRDRFLP